MSATFHHSGPLSALDIVRLILSFPPHRHIDVFDIDMEAGTYRYVAS